MDPQQQGPAPQAQPGNPGEQQPVQQPSQQPQQPPTQAAPAQQPAQAQPTVEELQRQIAERDEKLRLATDSARHWQSTADKERQRLQAMAGLAPQVDPMAEDVKFFVSQGYDEKDARALVEFTNRKVAGLTQQNQQLQQSLQATSATGQVIQAAAGDPEYTALFSDPAIANAVQQEMQRCALNGQAQFVTPEYAKAVAESAWAATYKPWKQGAPQIQQPQQTPQQFGGGFMGPQPGFRPAVVMPKPVDPAVSHFNNEIAAHFGLPKPQQ